jgi:hypothetical protein
MTGTITDAEFLAASYPPVRQDAVVSSGHAFLCRTRNIVPPARAMQDKQVSRTLRSLADHALIRVEPRVWRTEDRDLLIRLDGYGPSVDMDADAARLAVIDAIGATQATDEERVVIVEALHATASAMAPTLVPANLRGEQRIGCAAPVPWKPACSETTKRDALSHSWWTGPRGPCPAWALDVCERVPIDPDDASRLPRATCIVDGPVTLDGAFGMLLRPIAWSGRPHATLDPMGIVRAHAALASMLLRHPRTGRHEPHRKGSHR